ncbi:hypothetical protein [Mycolicibacterium peregrinum]|uniref:hypothetical protein n=1 Tax=Mycolicibacterium peregrinum TaxID=43304 RepID=UPI003AAA3E41
MMIGRPRRCLDCGAALPADADARRSFCGQACVSRAYRKRVRLLKRTARAREVIASFGQLNRLEKAGIVTGYLIIEGIQCPICAKVVWQGVRRRRDAVYCSDHCRQTAYRQRIHDAQL